VTIDFHPEAQEEFLQSIKYYERKALGLGTEFSDEIRTTLALLQSFPEIGQPFEESERKISLNRFPFSLIYNYNEGENHIEIYAVKHYSRRPGYWISRK
jgi:plasmid stabilization system protein ParE